MIRSGVNKVLIKPLKENDFIVKDGVVFYLDKSYQKEKHAITFGEIVANPPILEGHLKTTIETKVGDIVYFHYLAVINAIENKKFVETESGIIYSVSYDSLYCCKRGEEIICLNGYTLVKPKMVHEKDRIGNVFLPDSMMKKEHLGRGYVAYTGNPLKGEKRLVNPGDEILYRKSSNVPIQYDLHASLEGDNKFFRMKNDSILAIAQSATS